MTEATALPPAARHYLEQLDLEAAVLPAASRAQLQGQIREHLMEALDDGTAVEVVLERLGSPRELVAEAHPAATPRQSAHRWERTVLWCAVAGAAACGLGLFGLIAGSMGGLRAVLGVPSLVLLAGGATMLLAVGAVGILLQRGGVEGQGDLGQSLRTRPFLAAQLIVACGLLVSGALAVALGVLLFGMTGRLRAVLIVIPGVVLVTIAVVLLRRIVRAARSQPGVGVA